MEVRKENVSVEQGRAQTARGSFVCGPLTPRERAPHRPPAVLRTVDRKTIGQTQFFFCMVSTSFIMKQDRL